MGLLAIQCPACHVRLRVPDEFVNKRARCKRCGQSFVIALPSLEDSVVEWLHEGDAEAVGPGSAQTMPMWFPPQTQASSTAPTAPATPATPAGGPPRQHAARSAGSRGPAIRLSHVDALGAFFLFPPSLLAEPAFRTSMPRCCLCCGVTHSLAIHLVVWTSKLTDRQRAEVGTSGIHGSIRAEDLLHLSEAELLARLPHVPSMPPPFDLPMPYFICNRCTMTGAVMTHVQPTSNGGQECELGIASLKRAAEFLAHNVGRKHADYKTLLEKVNRLKNDPWQTLPLSLRHRIENWFKPAEGERFICYIRDNDYAKAEAGMGGLVLSDRRMVYHKFSSRKEMDLTGPLELRAENTHDHYLLRIGMLGERLCVLHCDASATELIRQTLRRVGVRYTYRA